MTLLDLYRQNFLLGGAYRRDIWPEGQYFKIAARPNNPNFNFEQSSPLAHGSWLGSMLIPNTYRWLPTLINPAESLEPDWSWVSSQEVFNLLARAGFDPAAQPTDGNSTT